MHADCEVLRCYNLDVKTNLMPEESANGSIHGHLCFQLCASTTKPAANRDHSSRMVMLPQTDDVKTSNHVKLSAL